MRIFQARRCNSTAFAAAASSCLAICSLTVYTAAGQPAADAPALADGVFSAAQVQRGRESFLDECIECHELAEFTAAGAYFEQQDGERLWDIFEFIWSEMPEDKPAWLEPEEYADILAYLLSVYGFPTGERDMPTDRATLRQIEFTRPVLPGS